MGLIRHIPLKYRLPLIHGILGLRARLRAKDWTKARTTDRLRPGGFVASAFLNESLGIGRAGRLTLDAFQTAGYSILSHDLRPAFRHWLIGGAQLPGQGGVWYIHANAPEVLVALLAHSPDQWQDRYRIAFWAWETPVAPESWVFVADYLHEIWLPSQFVNDAVAEAFSRAGRTDLIGRLRVMPHPLPRPAMPQRAQFDLSDKYCEVLCLFDTKSSATRKNPWAVIAAWRQAFPSPAAHARLTLKVSDLSNDPATRARLQTDLQGRTDIGLMDARLDDAEMAAFMASFDILISLHRSEGFGLTLTEAMTSGVAVIATGWSGNADFMTPDNAVSVPCRFIPVSDPDGVYGIVKSDPAQVWAEPDVAMAAQALVGLSGDPALRARLTEQALKDVAAINAVWTRQALSGLEFNRYLA